MRYNPALDGIRAVSALAVIAFHTRVPGFEWGYLGVDVFFVLSGYLITSVLKQQHDNGGIQLWPFYLRRAKRLYPPLVVMIAGYLSFAYIAWPDANHVRDSVIAGLYLSDYAFAFWKVPEIIGHTWSLSVEEHFYLIWPLIVPFVFGKQRAVGWLLVAYGVATVWRAWSDIYIGHHATMFRFDTNLTGLLLGCMLALMPKLPNSVPLLLTASASSLGVAAWLFYPGTLGGAMVACELFAAAIICLCVARPSLSHPVLAYLGRISYGMYLFHYPITMLVRPHVDWLHGTIIVLATTIVISAISYHTVEASFRNRKNAYLLGRGKAGTT